MRERTRLEESMNAYLAIEQDLNDNIELIEMGEAEGDEQVVKDAEAALMAARELAAKREVETLLSGEADGNDTYLEINAGVVVADQAAAGNDGFVTLFAGGSINHMAGAVFTAGGIDELDKKLLVVAELLQSIEQVQFGDILADLV